MNKEFYLWADSTLKITTKSMEKLRKVICGKYKTIDEKTYNRIINEEDIDRSCMEKFKMYPYNEEDIYEKENKMKKMNIWYVTIEEDDYPQKLREIYDPPYILYYMGDLEIANRFSIGVVGSRKCTDYGKNAVRNIVEDLSRNKVVIVSGMARGIDSYAHIFCMSGGTPTIAVMGTSIEKAYPKGSISLKKNILENKGLILSEHFIDCKTEPYHFAMRNRIISGLSDGLLVVEAKEKSGALITADCALQQNRNVYAVPGSIFSETSRGCNNLISEGAKPVQKSDDIAEDFNKFFITENVQNKNNNKKICKNSRNSKGSCVNIRFDDIYRENISDEEIFIVKILQSKGVLDIDELSVITGYNITDLIYNINNLIMKGLIVEEGVNRYAPNII